MTTKLAKYANKLQNPQKMRIQNPLQNPPSQNAINP